MNIAIKSLKTDLEELKRNGSDIAPLARSVLDIYGDELPDVEHSIVQLLDQKYQTAAKNIMQDIDCGDNAQCRFEELVRSAPFFELKTIDLTTGKDDAGNAVYFFTVAADNSGSAVKARIECKFYLHVLNLNELERSKAGANRISPFVVSFPVTIGEELPFSLI